MAVTVALPDGQELFKLNDVCKLANVQPYMLRFWGTEFPQLEAQKSGTGQRLYDRRQVELILEIRRLLFDEGLTIAGARKRLVAAEEDEVAAPPRPVRRTAAESKRARRTSEDLTAPDEDDDSPDDAPPPADDPPVEPRPRPVRVPPRAAVEPAEVDKAVASRVQPLLATLKDVREEVASIVAELRAGA